MCHRLSVFPTNLSIIVLLSALLASGGPCTALTDAQLLAVRDQCDQRRDDMLASQVISPYPDGVWGLQDFALAGLYLNLDANVVNAANAAVIDACNQKLNDPNCPSACSLHWNQNLFFRIYEYFSQDSEYFPGRLSPQAEDAICQVMWFWAQSESHLEDADIENSRTWWLWGSENHDAMHDTSNWSAAQILKDVAPYNTYTYNDGSTAQQQYDAWTEYFKEYLRERVRRGMLVEIFSPTYSKYTLQGWYNFYDFAEDLQLRQLAGDALTVWWADWLQEQIDGVNGGAKARSYQDASSLYGTGDAGMSWYYFGWDHTTAGSKHPGNMCMATSTYRPPLVVMDIGLDLNGRGTYACHSRRPGLLLLPAPPGVPADTYALDPDFGGIHRYTYCTPYFVMGTSMLEKREDWAAISSQNRWQGVIFKGHTRARIYPRVQGIPLDYGKTYNEAWSIQNKGTLITQKIAGSHNGDMRVYFYQDVLTITEEAGWVFAEAYGAYAAVRPAASGYSWDDSYWLRCNDSYDPVIMEVANASDYMDFFILFKTAVLNQSITINGGVLTYTGLGGSGNFTFYTNTSQPPELNGTPIDYAPDYTFDSPFMHQDWATGLVTISKDARELVLDFNVDGRCGGWGYLDSDIDKDCFVTVQDFAQVAEYYAQPAPYDIYVESGGEVVLEAEHYSSKTPGAGVLAGITWDDRTGDGSIGDGYVQALPDLGLTANDATLATESPCLNYQINFTTTGVYYFWIKGWGLDNGSDSIHYGLDGVPASTDTDKYAQLYQHGQFSWRAACGDMSKPFVQVSTPGLYTFNIWMREDGARLDRIVLRKNGLNDPPESPTESTRTQSGIPEDINGDNLINIEDIAIIAGQWTGCTHPQDPNNCQNMLY